MFGAHPSNEHQHKTCAGDEDGGRKIGWSNEQTDDDNRDDDGQKSFFKILDHILFAAQLATQVHEQRQLCHIGCLECHINDRQHYPATSFI